MRSILVLLLGACACAQTPNPAAPRPQGSKVQGDPQWRRNLIGVIGKQQPDTVGTKDIERMGMYLQSATPYCTSLTPGEYEANRDLARQVVSYLMMVNAMAEDPETRTAALRLSRVVAVFPCAYPATPGKPQSGDLAPPKAPDDPPFALTAPPIENVSAADKETAADLKNRFEMDAAKAAVVWHNAQAMRQSLASRGMSLNAQTEASVNRLQLFFEEAGTALQDHKWDDALASLQAAESETQKVGKAVGQ